MAAGVIGLVVAAFAAPRLADRAASRLGEVVAEVRQAVGGQEGQDAPGMEPRPVETREPAADARRAVKLLSTSVSTEVDRVQLGIEWLGLQEQALAYKVSFYDAASNLIHSSEGTIRQDAGVTYTWTPSVPAADFLQEGLASAEIWLDGASVATLDFLVQRR